MAQDQTRTERLFAYNRAPLITAQEARAGKKAQRTPPSGGSGVTRDVVPDAFPIGQQPSAPCAHDFVFLRDNYSHIKADAANGLMPRIPAEMTDTFYCRHCLAYREVDRK